MCSVTPPHGCYFRCAGEKEVEKHVRIIDNKLVYRSGEETLVIEPWGRDGLRVRVTPLPETIDRPWALTEPVDTQAHIETSDTA